MLWYKVGSDITVMNEPRYPSNSNDAIRQSKFQIRIVLWRSPSASGTYSRSHCTSENCYYHHLFLSLHSYHSPDGTYSIGCVIPVGWLPHYHSSSRCSISSWMQLADVISCVSFGQAGRQKQALCFSRLSLLHADHVQYRTLVDSNLC